MMLYFDLRLFVFFIQDWKMVLNCVSLVIVWIFSGKQRTEIVFRTKAYNIKNIRVTNRVSDEEIDEDEVEELQTYKSWKSVILLYELAQTLSLFHTIMFFAFWREDVYDFYFNVKEPKEPINQQMRVIILYSINTIGPLVMIFDMIFNKILFRLRHFWVGLLASVIFFAIQTLGREFLVNGDFPKNVEKLPEVYDKALAIGGYILCHFVLWLFSLIKMKMIKDPSHFKKDVRLEHVMDKYEKLLKTKEKNRRENMDTRVYDSETLLPEDNPQKMFMKEVLYNYLDKELKLKRED